MMHGHEKSDFAMVAGKPTNKAVTREPGTESRACFASPHSPRSLPFAPPTPRRIANRRWDAYGTLFAVKTRGGSRMRASRTYGGRGNSCPYREKAGPRSCSCSG
jgi:hypothetical protein